MCGLLAALAVFCFGGWAWSRGPRGREFDTLVNNRGPKRFSAEEAADAFLKGTYTQLADEYDARRADFERRKRPIEAGMLVFGVVVYLIAIGAVVALFGGVL